MLRAASGLVLLSLGLIPAHASAATGGAAYGSAPATPVAPVAKTGPARTPTPDPGGVRYNRHIKTLPPVARVFSVTPRALHTGHAPKIVVRIDEPHAHKVSLSLTFVALRDNGTTLNISGGRHSTGHDVVVAWPAHASLAAGRYAVILHAIGPHGLLLARRASASGRTTLTVTTPPKPKPAPAPAPAPVSTPTAPTPGGTFPVQGPHTYGDGFGALRPGHIHQGQDVLAALGTPVVAPLAGTIDTTGYQAAAAGYYVVENAVDGHSFFFAHCAHASTAVSAGQHVSQGQELCHVGQTGDATGPHLHFELWIGGWRVNSASHPIDPLAQLQAWDH